MSKFIDAQEMHKQHPDTFEVPFKSELDAIKEGSTVKVCNGKERFWTQVTDVDGDKLTATVDNNLIDSDGINLGDTIHFEKKNVYCVY